MSTHTPGPWALIDHGGGWFDIESENERYFFVCAAGSRDSQSDQQQSSANARLIAAAPDLLACLQEAIEDSDEVLAARISNLGERYRPERLKTMRAQITKARDAIAKATGAAT